MPPRKIKSSDIVRWIPNPGPQELLRECKAEIVLYGGAAGGGKTDAMIIDSAHDINISGYEGIIFRRTFPELEKHIIERSHALFHSIGRYNDKKHSWTFPTSDGGTSRLSFGYLEHDKDVFAYHGGQWSFMGFDESTMFSEFMIRFMLTRFRATSPHLRRRVLLASNPIGPGFGYHKLIFIETPQPDGSVIERQPFKIYRDATWPSDGTPIRKSTCFIPATVYDNPILLKADPGYIDNIKSQSPGIARALLLGSWKETISVAVVFDKKIHTTPPIEIPKDAPRWIGLDWGKRDKAAAVWQTSFGGRIYWYRDHVRPGKLIKPYAEEVVARSIGENINFVVLSHECFSHHGEGNTQADQFVEVFSKAGIPVVKSDKDPEGRLLLLREFLRVTPAIDASTVGGLEDHDFWQKRIEQYGDKAWKEYARLKLISEEGSKLPRLQLFLPGGAGMNMGCPDLLKTLPLLTVDITKPKRIAEGQDDHSFDGGTYGLKFYLNYDETSLLNAYMEQLGGKVPETTFQAEFAMAAAQEKLDEASGGDEPFEMEREKFEPSGRGGGLDF
jgi:Terminase large subunit, T4likevirus-type, N-terminal